jgi:hypothetical protein
VIGSRLQVSTRKFNLLLPDGCEGNAGGQEGVDQEGCNEGASQAGGNEEDASRESGNEEDASQEGGNEEPRHEICEDVQEPMESDDREEDASK